jgi:hypothetical protein
MLRLHLYPEDRGSILLRIVREVPDYMALNLKTQQIVILVSVAIRNAEYLSNDDMPIYVTI